MMSGMQPRAAQAHVFAERCHPATWSRVSPECDAGSARSPSQSTSGAQYRLATLLRRHSEALQGRGKVRSAAIARDWIKCRQVEERATPDAPILSAF